ncbi:hypothetical protein JTB14_028046 [Gonioctena quinquepunctata]|nr:hypothetical protein JTB14_028046 [Gonioctena quinquepunctata]
MSDPGPSADLSFVYEGSSGSEEVFMKKEGTQEGSQKKNIRGKLSLNAITEEAAGKRSEEWAFAKQSSTRPLLQKFPGENVSIP